MNSVALDIATILEGSTIQAGTLEEDLFVSQIPSSPDNCVAVYDTGGLAPEFFEKPTVMVHVRNRSYEAGYALALDIKQHLDRMYGVVIGDTRYICIWALQEPAFLQYDSNKRAIFAVNFRVFRTLDN